MIVIYIAKYIGKYKTAPRLMLGTSFSTAEIFEPYNTPVRMPTSLVDGKR